MQIRQNFLIKILGQVVSRLQRKLAQFFVLGKLWIDYIFIESIYLFWFSFICQ